MEPKAFVRSILDWYDDHGRKTLPWQHNPTAYRVWVSEVMLQQTQVTTVIDYYQRFMKRFPEIQDLANAHEDEVLSYWAGLGYYARGRNLHKTAIKIMQDFKGAFPTTLDELLTLPGIGRSTAGAILSLTNTAAVSILDGNVKRVLSRYFNIEGWYGNREVEKKLWALSDQYTPSKSFKPYTQAMMDMGAMICTRKNPNCDICPLQNTCQAKLYNLQHTLPTPRPKIQKPTKALDFIVFKDLKGNILLEKRPDKGIWGSLFAPIQCSPIQSPETYQSDVTSQVIHYQHSLKQKSHVFTHFKLDYKTHVYQVMATRPILNSDKALAWYSKESLLSLALPKPVKDIMLHLISDKEADTI